MFNPRLILIFSCRTKSAAALGTTFGPRLLLLLLLLLSVISNQSSIDSFPPVVLFNIGSIALSYDQHIVNIAHSHRSTGPQAHRPTDPQAHRPTGPQAHRPIGHLLRQLRTEQHVQSCFNQKFTFKNDETQNLTVHAPHTTVVRRA